MSKGMYKAKYWDCGDFYVIEKLNILITKSFRASAIADHVTSTGHTIKRPSHFNIFVKRTLRYTLLICDLNLPWMKTLKVRNFFFTSLVCFAIVRRFQAEVCMRINHSMFLIRYQFLTLHVISPKWSVLKMYVEAYQRQVLKIKVFKTSVILPCCHHSVPFIVTENDLFCNLKYCKWTVEFPSECISHCISLPGCSIHIEFLWVLTLQKSNS